VTGSSSSQVKAPHQHPWRGPVWHGPWALCSKTALALLCFWVLLGLVLAIPSPLRDRLLSASEEVAAAPTGGAPALPGLPAPAPEPAAPAEQPTPAGAPAEKDKVEPLQDPQSGMAAFYRALSRTEAKKTITRVLHYGDSLIDLDFVTAPVRRALQKRFGDAGHGFVLAAKPWSWYNHMDISLFTSGKDCWDHFRLVGKRRRDGRLGLGCAAIESKRGVCRTRVAMRDIKASRIEVHYLMQPGAGKLRVEVDGKQVGELSTAADRKRSGFSVFKVADAPHTIRLTAVGKVRVFGVALERGRHGVTWENLPLVSARFNQLIRLNQSHWAEQLKHRSPDLVVFQFGANDTISYGGSIDRYGAQVLRALKLVRRALPGSSCLIIGPLDRLTRNARGELRSPGSVRTVSDKQREVAFAAGCAFWDGQKAMGGPGSMKRWLKRRLVLKDMVHLNRRGSDIMGDIFERALMAGYRQHKLKHRAGKNKGR
jgi:lysophospholipase L1-like esterase